MTRLSRIHNIDDMRAAARRRLPRGMFEFFDRGTEDERALAANRDAFAAVRMLPRVMVDVSTRRLGTSLFGQPAALPLGIAPTGAAGLMWFDGEIATARAARAAGLPFALSTVSLTSIERIADEAGGRLWFQLYPPQDEALGRALIDRAKAAGYEALVLTVDTVGNPNREYNLRNGFGVPFSFTARNMIDGALHPDWLVRSFLRQLRVHGFPRFGNFPDDGAKLTGRTAGATMAKKLALGWDDLSAVRRSWAGPLIVKGILHPDDARRAADLGADAVVISNHGGRNFDSAPAPLTVLPRIAEALAGRATVMLDGGIRRGSDVVKALALGADFVLAGKAPLYGAAAAGQEGVTHVLDILRDEIDRTLTFLGCPDIADLRGVETLHG